MEYETRNCDACSGEQSFRHRSRSAICTCFKSGIRNSLGSRKMLNHRVFTIWLANITEFDFYSSTTTRGISSRTDFGRPTHQDSQHNPYCDGTQTNSKGQDRKTAQVVRRFPIGQLDTATQGRAHKKHSDRVKSFHAIAPTHPKHSQIDLRLKSLRRVQSALPTGTQGEEGNKLYTVTEYPLR